MIDKVPASVRHFIIVAISGVLTWASQVLAAHQADPGANPVTWQSALWGLGAAVVSAALLWFTALTRQYGVGADVPPVQPEV